MRGMIKLKQLSAEKANKHIQQIQHEQFKENGDNHEKDFDVSGYYSCELVSDSRRL